MNRIHADIQLRDTVQDDLAVFFSHQQDPTAVHMAAFTAKKPSDWRAFERKWGEILEDATVVVKTIEVDGRVAGHVAKYLRDGLPELTYWIGREYWGRGVATAALRAFLVIIQDRPIHAAAAKDNIGSIRVLKKCGFVVTGEQMGFANARGIEIPELLLTLRAAV